MTTIATKSNANEKLDRQERTIELDCPEVLTMETVEDLVNMLGADVVVHKVKAQLTVDFRSHIRTMLESKDKDGQLINSDEAIKDKDFDQWKPTGRTRKTGEEKAIELMGGMTPEKIASIFAKVQAEQAEIEDLDE